MFITEGIYFQAVVSIIIENIKYIQNCLIQG
jgi:hypothetical protein